MYGLVVKTSFGVWRLSFMSPHFRVGGHCVCHGRLSFTKSCPLCNLKTVQDILMLLHRILTNIRGCARRKKP